MILAAADSNAWLLPLLVAGSFVASVIGTWLMIRRGRRLFLDVPNARSAHSVPTPRGGGIAFVAVFFVAATVFGFVAHTDLRADCRWIPLAMFPLALVGIVDDLRGLAPLLRFLAQMLTACLIVILIGRPLPTFVGEIGTAATALIVFLITIPIAAAINFSNFMDGLDGLVAGMSAVQIAFLGWWLDVPIAWPLLAAVLGFLVWNWPPAKIFMGDTGSTFLGASPVLLGVLSNAAPAQVIAGWAVTAPLHVDASLTLLRRAARGANVLEGHREHLYQRLQSAGWSHRRVTLSYAAVTIACAALIAGLHATGAVAAVVLSLSLYGAGEIYLRRRVSSQGA
ncbi:MAG: glycosyltransferase family 4 protein [Phycisphaerae bacterium]|nr:glycosyltransferase family 4 protein [Phycisphaerae bacterium]